MPRYHLRPLIFVAVTLCMSAMVCAVGFRIFYTPAGDVMVTFLDVGQGDAIFIESPTGTQVLIDGGKDRRILAELQAVMGFFDREIDMVVATHPDADHIGGLVDVFERYTVDTVLMTENNHATPVTELFETFVRAEGSTVRYARAGDVYELGVGKAGSTSLTILFPDRDVTEMESNASSIIARLVYGQTSYLFTGDAPTEIERYLVSIQGNTLQSTVLKAGHHGSRTSSDPGFVGAVLPQYAIISAGKDNTYGHPHPEVVDILNQFNVRIFQTGESGSIRTYADGVRVIVRP